MTFFNSFIREFLDFNESFRSQIVTMPAAQEWSSTSTATRAGMGPSGKSLTTVSKTQTYRCVNHPRVDRPRIVHHDNIRAISAVPTQPALCKDHDHGRRLSSVSEGAWKNSLRQKEKLLPAIPNPAARARGFERKNRSRSMERISRRRETGRIPENDPDSPPSSLSSGIGNKENNRSVSESTRENRKKSPQGYESFSRRNKLDQTMVDELSNDIISSDLRVNWRDIAGLDEAKSLLQEAVVLPLIMPEFFRGIRRPWKGILMIGPPGTGKTMLAKAVASECKTTFFNVSSSSLTSKYRGESEKLVKHLFELARYHAPSIIFIDEVDALCSQRGSDSEHEASKRFKAELLTQMDGLSSHGDETKVVMVLAATNYPWLIDEAFRRRFEKRIHIGMPNREARRSLLDISLSSMKVSEEVDLERIADDLDSYSASDITNLCRDAAMMSMRKAIKNKPLEELKQIKQEEIDKPITQDDFKDALERCKNTCSDIEISRYEEWMSKHGSY